MSVVIVGGNDCMVRKYKELCGEYQCDAKVFTQMRDGLKNKFGSPDLLVLFTGTMSHKMLRSALTLTLATDPHPLGCLRTNVTVQQFGEFCETYGVKPGDGRSRRSPLACQSRPRSSRPSMKKR